LYHFDDEFAGFWHYRVHRRSERPWHLVIGGDFIEFLFISTTCRTGPPPAARGALQRQRDR